MRIKSIVHVVAAWIMLVLTSEFSLTVAYDICDTNPWARILYVALNISSLLAAFYLYTRYIIDDFLCLFWNFLNVNCQHGY